MKKVLSFFGCAMLVAAMTVSCGQKNAEQTEDTVAPEAIENATEMTSNDVVAVDNSAMLAAAKEAGEKICECTKGDAASIESCMKSILEAGYADYAGNDEFAAAVRAEVDNCIKEKAKAVATEAANEGIKKGAEALAGAIKK